MRTICGFKKSIIFSLVFLVLLFLLIEPAEAAKTKIRVKVAKADIRLKPNEESIVISQAPLGAILVSEDKAGEWYKISLPPDEHGVIVSGYIHQSMIEVVEEIRDVLEEERTAKKEPQLYEEKKPSPQRKFQLKAGGGIAVPTGDWSEDFNIGPCANLSGVFNLVPEVSLIGGVEFGYFDGEYEDSNVIALVFSLDGRYSYNVQPSFNIFGELGFGLYYHRLEFWGFSDSETDIGIRLGGGVGFKKVELMGMYHIVEDYEAFSFIISFRF